jgi:UDP-glucose 4-epimerase
LNQRILVTGAAGFIGSHVTQKLLQNGDSVVALCKYSSSGSRGFLNNLDDPKLQIVLGDLTDTELIRGLCSDVDIVINLAALIGIPYSYQAPRSYVNVNVGGTLNILEAIKNRSTKLIQLSTSEVYGTPKSIPITLDHSINPQSPYAASKVAADALCLSYVKTFGTNAAIVRPFNTYGPRQSLRAIIPTILHQISSGSYKIKIGNAEAKRDFTFIDDTVAAIVSAAHTLPGNGSVVQLGTGRTISIAGLIGVCEETFGIELEIDVDASRIRPTLSEVEVLQSDPSSALNSLGWSAKVSLADGLKLTMDWISSEASRENSSSPYVV